MVATELWTASTSASCTVIKGQVELQHVDVRGSEDPQGPSTQVVLHDLAQACGVEVAGSGDHADLRQRRGLTDVGIEPREVSGDQVDWHRSVGPIWVLGDAQTVEIGCVFRHMRDEDGVARAQVASD